MLFLINSIPDLLIGLLSYYYSKIDFNFSMGKKNYNHNDVIKDIDN